MADCLDGLQDAQERLQEAIDQYGIDSVHGLANAALRIAEDSQRRAPVETGDLRGSVFVDLGEDAYAIGTEDGRSVEIVGAVPETATKALIGFNSPYAAAQHEHTEYSHPSQERLRKYARGGADAADIATADAGQAKYLESVVLEMAGNGELLEIIASAIGGGY